MSSEKHPRDAAMAAVYRDRAMLALRHALPQGTHFVVIVQGPGFNTFGSNVDDRDTLHLTQGLTRELQNKALGIRST